LVGFSKEITEEERRVRGEKVKTEWLELMLSAGLLIAARRSPIASYGLLAIDGSSGKAAASRRTPKAW